VTLRTEYEFTLPRGYVDRGGSVHQKGVMRLATARDELEPLRNPTITGPDDPRLTILILARVVTKLGDLPMITANEIEGLFAVDLAFLQDFYGVINFGSQEEYEALLAAQQPVGVRDAAPAARDDAVDGDTAGDGSAEVDDAAQPEPPVRTRASVVEVPRGKD
jgi:hypothetical protein